MTLAARLSRMEVVRKMVALAYGDLSPFLDAHGYLVSPGDLPASAAMQIEGMQFVKTATGDRIKPTVVSPAGKRKLVKRIEQLEHHSDPAVRQAVVEERRKVLADCGTALTTHDKEQR